MRKGSNKRSLAVAFNEESNEGKSNEGKSNEGKASQGKASQGQSNEGKSNKGQSNEGKSNEGKSNEGKSNEGKSNKGKSNEGKASQGKASQENIIKKILDTKNKTGKTIKRQFENIFTNLSQYSLLLSKDIRSFMDNISSGLVSLNEYPDNINKLIAELTKIISVLNGNTTNNALQDKLDKHYKSTKDSVKKKLIDLLKQLNELNKFT
jgi:hypothetical protein